MDKFESIRAFTQVVEAGGFAAAARKMQLSRSAVNKLVFNLENHLGVQLLYRTTRQVTPTDDGLAFYERCLDILASIAEAELALTQKHQQPKGKLKINVPMSFGIAILGSKVAKFMTHYPDLQVELTLEDRFVDPISEGYDLLIRLGTPSDSPNLMTQTLTTLPRILCASGSYLQAQGVPQTFQDLKNHSCLHYRYLLTGSYWELSQGDTTERVLVNGVFCSNNGEVLRDAAIQGLGIVLLPHFIVAEALKKGELEIILPHCQPPDLPVSGVYPANRHLSTKVQLLLQFLRENLSGF